MYKLKKSLWILLIFILLFPLNTYASASYSTDDLRVLMGMYRLSEDNSMKEIKNLLSTCYRQKEWNELVSSLVEVDNSQLNDFKEKEEAWYQAKDILEENFTNNKSVDIVLDDYINYQTASSVRVEYKTTNSYELSLIDTSDIEKTISYAKSLLAAVDDKTNIGDIGKDMQTFTKDNLLISVPFGNSFDINSGEKRLSNGIEISIQDGNEIFAQLNGIVTDVTVNSVTVKTGKSIEIEYIGIKPSVEKKQKIKQYNMIGKTKTKSMIIKFKLNTVYADPLLLYGSRSIKWYSSWEDANPGCTIDKKDYSELLDDLTVINPETASSANNGGITINEEGVVSQLLIQGDNNYMDTPDNLLIEKADSEIFTNE